MTATPTLNTAFTKARVYKNTISISARDGQRRIDLIDMIA
jgi:hypothetical protein